MGFDIGTLGMEAGSSLISTGLGLALEGHNDRRQLDQQSKLQSLQIKGQKEMTDYNMMKQLEMWHNTSYSAQVAEMEKAGVNPALLYGMSGGGGQTTGNANGNVSGAAAPSGGHEILDVRAQMMQTEMMQAQIELAKSQANKNNVEAEKTAGVDTTKAQTEIQSLTQGISNQKAIEALTHVETELKKVDLGFNKATYQDRVEYIAQEAREMYGKASIALIQANLDTDARDTRLKTIKAEYVQRLLENALITAKTKGEYQAIKESESNIQLNDQKIQQIAQGILMDWDKLSNDNQRLRLQQVMTDYNTDPSNEVIEGLSRGIGSILTMPIIGGMKGAEGATPIRGFHKR